METTVLARVTSVSRALDNIIVPPVRGGVQ